MNNIKINDYLILNDKNKCYNRLQGEVIFGRNPTLIEFIDPYGNHSYRTEFGEVLFRSNNIVPIGSYQFLMSKIFNLRVDDPIRTNLKVGAMNDDYQLRIGVNPSHYRMWDYNSEIDSAGSLAKLRTGVNISALDFIFGFMIGDGGAREDNITAIAPDYKRRQLYHPIPFLISNEPNAIWNQRYFGRFTDLNGTTSFYVKKFETNNNYPHIVHAWVTDDDKLFQPVDESVFASTSSTPIETYVELFLKIEEGEVIDYFKRTNATPRINELGLVSGWYNPEAMDYENLRLSTAYCRPTIVLSGKGGDSIDIIYRLYAR